MKVNVNNLPKQPELFYLIESRNLINSDMVNIDDLEKYDGSVIGGYELNFLSLYNTIVRRDINKSSMIRQKANKDIPNESFKTEIFGSRILDYFCLGGNKTIINGICPNRLTSIDFENLRDLLLELNVCSYYFLSIENPFEVNLSYAKLIENYKSVTRITSSGHFEEVTLGCVHEGIKFNMFRFRNPRGGNTIPKKLFICRDCHEVFCTCPSEKKFFDDKNLKQPKLCPSCRESKRQNEMRMAAV